MRVENEENDMKTVLETNPQAQCAPLALVVTVCKSRSPTESLPLICTFFGEKKKIKISDPWGSKWKLPYQDSCSSTGAGQSEDSHCG